MQPTDHVILAVRLLPTREVCALSQMYHKVQYGSVGVPGAKVKVCADLSVPVSHCPLEQVGAPWAGREAGVSREMDRLGRGARMAAVATAKSYPLTWGYLDFCQ